MYIKDRVTSFFLISQKEKKNNFVHYGSGDQQNSEYVYSKYHCTILINFETETPK